MFFLVLFTSNRLNAAVFSIEGTDFSNLKGEILYKQPEGTRDSADTIVYASASQNEILKIRHKKIDSVSIAKKMIQQKMIQLLAVYRPAAVPYAGAITSTMDCTKKFDLNKKINEKEQSLSVSYELESNNQLAYGECDEDKLVKNLNYQIVFCKKNKSFFEIKYFISKSQKLKPLLGVECQ